MNGLFRTALLVPAALLMMAPSLATAHWRSFAHTYQYQTVPRGETELEIWNTQRRSDLGDSGVSAFDWQFEVEWGITDRWDMAIYQVLAQTSAGDDEGASLRFDATKVETRFRLGERGQGVVDPLLYLEVAKSFGETHYEIEPKLVLARDFGRSTLALNLIPEVEIEKEEDSSGEDELEVEFEPGWALGWCTEASARWRVGAETFGGVSSFGDANDVSASVGPTVSWGASEAAWVTVNAAFGITDETDDVIVRFLIGLGL